MRPVKEQICQYLMWRKSRPENRISAEVEEKVENAIQVRIDWRVRTKILFLILVGSWSLPLG